MPQLMCRCGGFILLLLDTVNRRERKDQSLRRFGSGGGQQRHMPGLVNKINVEDDMYH